MESLRHTRRLATDERTTNPPMAARIRSLAAGIRQRHRRGSALPKRSVVEALDIDEAVRDTARPPIP